MGADGVPVFTFIAIQLAVLVPHELFAVTHILPLEVPKFNVMDVLPCPVDMVASDGTVQVYPVAPGTTLIEYVTPVAFWQTVVIPVMLPGFEMLIVLTFVLFTLTIAKFSALLLSALIQKSAFCEKD